MKGSVPERPTGSLAGMGIVYVASPAEFFHLEFRAWLQTNHAIAGELWVGYHRVATGRPPMTWAESVDDPLLRLDRRRAPACRRRALHQPVHTPKAREPRRWSDVNVRRALELIEEGRMHPAGAAAFAARTVADHTWRVASLPGTGWKGMGPASPAVVYVSVAMKKYPVVATTRYPLVAM
ncbi:MAG: YdeI/OmpD-associated family protein [Actinomycetota bacterium]